MNRVQGGHGWAVDMTAQAFFVKAHTQTKMYHEMGRIRIQDWSRRLLPRGRA